MGSIFWVIFKEGVSLGDLCGVCLLGLELPMAARGSSRLEATIKGNVFSFDILCPLCVSLEMYLYVR